ncbi:polyamine oxidase 5-like isoform X2 [Phoenix dactylifera]|uniref:Polyamine oxidase 5-like isoform X2 n=1 Tax=Phoenix dactylifera TaxID=42345 RepID=A0A8B8ZLW1_PHODC|nr:polyamine oxidase 5-like isoform X2 [Phoenix dactylifera]
MAAEEKNRAVAVAMNAEIRRTKARLIEELALNKVQYLVSRWGTDPDSLGSYSCDLVGKLADLYERFRTPVDNLYFAGEAASVDHSGSVLGAYTSGILAAEDCRRHILLQHGISDRFQIVLREAMSEMIPFQISRM